MTAAATILLGGVAYTPFVAHTDAPVTGTLYQPTDPVGQLVTIGDSFSESTGPGGSWGETNGWPVRVAAAVGRELVPLAVGGSGYLQPTARWDGVHTFPLAAAQVPASADVVIVFGGVNDLPRAAADVGAAAQATFATIKQRAPRAQLLVIGPQKRPEPMLATLTAYRDQVRAAALEAGALWVDPIAEDWLQDPALLDDGWGARWHPNDTAGQDFLVEQITPHVRAALAR